MMSSKRPRLQQAQSVNTLLKEILAKPGLGEQITRHQAWLVWDKIVGNQIAARARPLRLRKGILEIAVDHPVWMQQLQMMKTQILAKIQEQIPKAGITDLYLRKAGHYATTAPPRTTPQKTPPLEDIKLSAAERSHIDHLVKSVENPELQQELRRFFSLQARLQKKRES
jgi:predicted nucleic acid-binding Zn ribbon protein